MANVIYPKWKEALLTGAANSALNGSGTTGVYVVLVDAGTYTYNAAHQFYSDLSGIAPVAEQECLNKTYANGAFDHDNPTWPSVPGTVTYEAIVYFIKNAGANTTWRLVAYKDTGISNLPVTANGQNITQQVNASGSFAL